MWNLSPLGEAKHFMFFAPRGPWRPPPCRGWPTPASSRAPTRSASTRRAVGRAKPAGSTWWTHPATSRGTNTPARTKKRSNPNLRRSPCEMSLFRKMNKTGKTKKNKHNRIVFSFPIEGYVYISYFLWMRSVFRSFSCAVRELERCLQRRRQLVHSWSRVRSPTFN